MQQTWKLLGSQVVGILGLVFGLIFARFDLGGGASRPATGPLGSAPSRAILVSEKQGEKSLEMTRERYLDAQFTDADLAQALKVAILALLNGPNDNENADDELPPGFELEVIGSQGVRDEVVLHRVGTPRQTLRIGRDFTLQGDLKIPHFLNLGSVNSKPGRTPAMVLENASRTSKVDHRLRNSSEKVPVRKKRSTEPLEFEGLQ